MADMGTEPAGGINGPLPGDPSPVIGYGQPGSFPAGSTGGTSAAPITYAQTTQLSPSQIAQIYGQQALSDASNPASGAYGQSQYNWRPAPGGGIMANNYDPNRVFTAGNGESQTWASLIDNVAKASGMDRAIVAAMDPQTLQNVWNGMIAKGTSDQQAANYQRDAAQAQQMAQQNFNLNQAKMQTDWQKAMADTLTSALKGPFGPGMIPVLNADLQKLGLPQVNINGGNGQGQQGVMPNGISPAAWDALGTAAQQMILQAWQARGGDPKDFLAGIDAQRPSSGGGSVTARYAPIAA